MRIVVLCMAHISLAEAWTFSEKVFIFVWIQQQNNPFDSHAKNDNEYAHVPYVLHTAMLPLQVCEMNAQTHTKKCK